MNMNFPRPVPIINLPPQMTNCIKTVLHFQALKLVLGSRCNFHRMAVCHVLRKWSMAWKRKLERVRQRPKLVTSTHGAAVIGHIVRCFLKPSWRRPIVATAIRPGWYLAWDPTESLWIIFIACSFDFRCHLCKSIILHWRTLHEIILVVGGGGVACPNSNPPNPMWPPPSLYTCTITVFLHLFKVLQISLTLKCL